MDMAWLKWVMLGYCVFALVMFPILSFIFIHRAKKVKTAESQPGYSELKASLLFLQTAFPTILFLLGALGYGSFEVIINKVTNTVTERVNKIIEKDKIAAWTAQIELDKDRAQANAELIEAMYTGAVDSIRSLASQTFVHLLPKGTIVPYSGRRDSIDFNYWAICDGTNRTPDLRSRFIIGSSFRYLGRQGGNRSHSHTASTVPRGNVSRTDVLRYPHKDGLERDFTVERHSHSFTGTRSPVTVAKTDHLPPYYRLVFLMKIK